MRVAVVGAGIGGLTTALLLDRAGHDVVLLEADVNSLAADPDAAFLQDRRGTPQARHSHAFLARLRNVLRDYLPDVLADVVAAGATEVSWADALPDTLDERAAEPGDEDLVMLACRRTTFDWALRRAVRRSGNIEVRDGQRVVGLAADIDRLLPRVTGVRTSTGTVVGDLVVDAAGRRSPFPALVAELGVTMDSDERDAGIVYFSRFYRLNPGVLEPTQQTLTVGDLGYVKYAVFRGDNRTFSVTLALASEDGELRRLLGGSGFDLMARMISDVSLWVDPATSEPITDVHLMAGLVNRVRHFVNDERPEILGVLPVGDSAVCTNPLYGRGCSLAAVHAQLLVESLDEHEHDPEALAQHFHDATRRELMPWYYAAVDADEAAKRAFIGSDSSGDTLARSILTEGLLALARVDALVNRAWMRTFNLLTTPSELIADQEVMKRAIAFWQARDGRAPMVSIGPCRDEIVAALTPPMGSRNLIERSLG